MRQIVVLRPEPGASMTAERARQRGLEPVIVPLFEVEPVTWQAPEPEAFDALLLTSANTVHIGGDQLEKLRELPVYAVGVATAQAAYKAGFNIASVGEAGVDRLLNSIDPELKLLHLCGEERREPQGARRQIAPMAVYRARAIDAPDLARADGGVVLVHSPRAGQRLSDLVKDRASIAIAAISPPAAEAVGNGWERIESARAPNDEALLALAALLCNKPAPQ